MKKLRVKRRKKIEDMLEKERMNIEENPLCKESVDAIEVMKHPQDFIEVNIVKRKRYVVSFYVSSELPSFTYDKKKYVIREKGVYLLPRQHVNHSFFVPCSFYYEGKNEPINFKQMNRGITGKALTLLYKNGLYETLLKKQEKNYNLFIVILLIIQLILFVAFIYLSVNGVPIGNGGVIPA